MITNQDLINYLFPFVISKKEKGKCGWYDGVDLFVDLFGIVRFTECSDGPGAFIFLSNNGR